MSMSRRKSAVRPLPAAPLRLLVPLKKSLVNATTLPSRSQICKHLNIQGVESKAASVKPLLKLDPVCSLACSRTRPGPVQLACEFVCVRECARAGASLSVCTYAYVHVFTYLGTCSASRPES
jgi:hypothetical protein